MRTNTQHERLHVVERRQRHLCVSRTMTPSRLPKFDERRHLDARMLRPCPLVAGVHLRRGRSGSRRDSSDPSRPLLPRGDDRVAVSHDAPHRHLHHGQLARRARAGDDRAECPLLALHLGGDAGRRVEQQLHRRGRRGAASGTRPTSAAAVARAATTTGRSSADALALPMPSMTVVLSRPRVAARDHRAGPLCELRVLLAPSGGRQRCACSAWSCLIVDASWPTWPRAASAPRSGRGHGSVRSSSASRPRTGW